MKPVSKPTIFTSTHALSLSGTGVTPEAIVGLYQQVIAKDASFAPAYAGLAAAYAASSFQGFRDHTDDELMQMRAAAEKAIQLDPLLAEAHQALGMVYARDGQWAQSEKSFRRAIELDPSNSLAYSDLTIVSTAAAGPNRGRRPRDADCGEDRSALTHRTVQFGLGAAVGRPV